MNVNERELIYREEMYRIVGSAMSVSNTLGCGFLEAVYQEAMEIELRESRVPFEAQKRIHIQYKDRILQQEYVADFLCYECIIVEIKATKLPLGLVVNFGAPRLEWKRYINTKGITNGHQ